MVLNWVVNENCVRATPNACHAAGRVASPARRARARPLFGCNISALSFARSVRVSGPRARVAGCGDNGLYSHLSVLSVNYVVNVLDATAWRREDALARCVDDSANLTIYNHNSMQSGRTCVGVLVCV